MVLLVDVVLIDESGRDHPGVLLQLSLDYLLLPMDVDADLECLVFVIAVR